MSEALYSLPEILIGDTFATMLLAELGAETLAAVVKANSLSHDPHVCASHDHCDANMTMLAAIERVTGLTEIDGDDDEHCSLWNGAWSYAKALGFAKALNSTKGAQS